MSWIREWKDKAESFLDKLDDVAASALQKPPSNAAEPLISVSATRVQSFDACDADQFTPQFIATTSSDLALCDNEAKRFDVNGKIARHLVYGDAYVQQHGESCSSSISETNAGGLDFAIAETENRDGHMETILRRLRELEDVVQCRKSENGTGVAADTATNESCRKAVSVEEQCLLSIQQIEECHLNVRRQLAGMDVELEGHRQLQNESAEQLSICRRDLDDAREELERYRTKAMQILQNKENVIKSLKETASHLKGDDCQNLTDAEKLKAECDSLKEKLRVAKLSLSDLQTTVKSLESQRFADRRASMERIRQIEEELQGCRLSDHRYRLQIHKLEQDVQSLSEEAKCLRARSQAVLRERDTEIRHLRDNLSLRVGAETEDQRDVHLKQLTDSLIKKQSLIETLQTDRQSLLVQLERLQAAYYRMQSNPTHKSSGSSNPALDRAGFLWRSPVVQYVGHLAGTQLNKLCSFFEPIASGMYSILRRYPVVRVVLLLYAAALHLWVAFILLTYSAEMHSVDQAVVAKAPFP